MDDSVPVQQTTDMDASKAIVEEVGRTVEETPSVSIRQAPVAKTPRFSWGKAKKMAERGNVIMKEAVAFFESVPNQLKEAGIGHVVQEDTPEAILTGLLNWDAFW